MATTTLSLGIKGAEFPISTYPSLFKDDSGVAPLWALSYDQSADEAAYWRFPIVRYGSGNLTLTLLWTSQGPTSGNVVWGAAIAAITPDTDNVSILSKTFATEQTVTDSHLGSTGDRVMQCQITISNLDSVANNDIVAIRIRRIGSNGSDTLAGDALLLGAVLTYSDT